jgi:cysteine-rich repeat protein
MSRRKRVTERILLVAVLGALAGCGDSIARCGNGDVEGAEQCDDGNSVDDDGCRNDCRTSALVATTVRWTLVAEEFTGFTGETCSGVGAETAVLTLTGPMPMTAMLPCSNTQTTYNDLPAGDYQLRLQLLDGGGAPVTNGNSSLAFTVGSESQILDFDIPYGDFVVSKTGTFFFRTLFGGSRMCGPVVTQILALSRGGVPMTATTNAGDPVDGVTKSPCRPANMESQAILSLAWGPIRIHVTGLDASDVPIFEGSFDTFSGAGIANPAIELDLPAADGGL